METAGSSSAGLPDRPDRKDEGNLETVVYADTLAAIESAMRCMSCDLRHLVEEAHFHLVDDLDARQEIAWDDRMAAELLLHDIERMLRHGLASAVHLVLCEREVNANNQYPIRYYASYEVRRKMLTYRAGAFRGMTQASSGTPTHMRFVLGISWNLELAADKSTGLKPPEYFFSWRPERHNIAWLAPL